MSRKAIGIDFGSSQSSVAIMDIGSTGIPKLLPIGRDNAIPTLMALDENDDSVISCGHDVLKYYRKGKIETVKFASNFKRLLGRTPRENADDNEKNANFYCSLYLKELSRLVKEKLNEKELKSKDYATCIAYPATWDKTQVDLLKKYVEEAGFPSDPGKGIYTVEEPVAAMYSLNAEQALSFHYGDRPEHYMVIDFGGGTLDICIIETDILGRDPQPVSKTGDPELGGKDFDEIIGELFFQQNEGISKKDLSRSECEDLRNKFKEAKEAISIEFLNRDESKYSIQFRGQKSLTINKKDFVEICERRGYFDRIKKAIHDALENAHIDASEISKVILTGGSSKWFFLRKIVANELNISINSVFNTNKPFTDVASGCAIKIARSALPLYRTGVWVKCKIGENGVWSLPKNILRPNEMTEDDVIDIYLCTITQTRYLHPYQITISLWKGLDENRLERINDIAVFQFYARSNTPFLKRLKAIWHALRGSKEKKNIPDNYNVFLSYKNNEKEGASCQLRILDSGSSNATLEHLHNGKDKWDISCEVGEVKLGMKSYCPLLGLRKRTYLELKKEKE